MTSAGVHIEPMAPRFADAVQRLAADARIAATTKVPHPYPADGARTWIARATADRERGTMYAFAIVDEHGELVGPCALMSVDRVARAAELGYWIGVPHWGRGLATEGARQVLAFGFVTLGLERIVAQCLDHNTASRRVLAKLGFAHVGPASGDARGVSSAYALTQSAWRAQSGSPPGPAPVLLVPGLGDSGPEHWHSHWERSLPDCRRVVQDEWDRPTAAAWIMRLQEALARERGPVVLAAHSLACCLVARWAQAHVGPVSGALLVAPADVEAPGFPPDVTGFAPMPMARLPFRSIVVASTNDPWATLERQRAFAEAWGAEFVVAGAHGHLASDAKLGEWPEGRHLLGRLRA